MALAAFIAGLAVGEGHESAEARRRIIPFRDLFAILFFVALGSLLDPSRFPEALPWLAVVLGLVIVAKAALAYVLARVVRLDEPDPAGRGAGPDREFSFVLATVGLAAEVIDPILYAAILAAIAISIAASTAAVRFVPRPRPAPG